MADVAFELENLNCKIGRRYLLQDINWKVNCGEKWVVYGMNGSGKTTLLSILAGFRSATSGEIRAFGNPYTNETILGIRKQIGWVSSSFFDKVYKKESVLDVIMSAEYGTLSVEGYIKAEEIGEVYELLKKMDMQDKLYRPFYTLSKGEMQNILIVRAIFSRASVLILDEPCTGLDAYYRSYLFHNLEEMNLNKNMTILYVTHYVEEILPMFDYTLLLKKGHVYQQGKTDALINKEVLDDFMGYPVEVTKQNGEYRMKVQTDTTWGSLIK